MTITDDCMIMRAGSHARAQAALRPSQRLQHGVTELAVARLLHGLESGHRVVRTATGQYRAHTGPLRGLANLTTVVQEAIRTGLVHYSGPVGGPGTLTAARVHLRALRYPDGATCGEVAVAGPFRLRLVDDPLYVDCLSCLRTERDTHL